MLKKATAAPSLSKAAPRSQREACLDDSARRLLDLAVALDLFSRKVVDWSLGDSLATALVMQKAIEQQRPQRGELLHHSDRGCQYTSEAYQKTLNTLGSNVR